MPTNPESSDKNVSSDTRDADRTLWLVYSLILSCLCIRSTLRSLYWAWMVLQWPISSTNSLDRTPCCREGTVCVTVLQFIIVQYVCHFKFTTQAHTAALDQKTASISLTCVRCIRMFMGIYFPPSSPFFDSIPVGIQFTRVTAAEQKLTQKHRVHLLITDTHSSVFSESDQPKSWSLLAESGALSSYLTQEESGIFSTQTPFQAVRRDLDV